MELSVSITQIIISVALTVVILLQVKSSSLGGMFGGSDSAVYRTRRGLERTLFNITIGLSIAFFAVIILNVVFSPVSP